LLRLLDECVQYHDASAREKAVERSSDACLTSWSKFEKTISESARIRKPQIRTVLHEKFYDPRIVREDLHRPCFNFREHLGVEVFDGVLHDQMFSYLRTKVNHQLVKPSVRLTPARRASLSKPLSAGIIAIVC
jgi:hypothetical protein